MSTTLPPHVQAADHDLAEAYERIGIKDPHVSDVEIVAAFHASHATQKREPTFFTVTPIRALEKIARYRQSGLLAFILTIVPHLNEGNVQLLLKDAPRSALSHTIEAGPSGPAGNVSAVNGGQENTVESSTALAVRNGDDDRNETPSSSDDLAPADDDEDNTSEYSAHTSSLDHYSGDSGSSDIPDSPSEEPYKHFDFYTWRCEECQQELVDDKCPDGHPMFVCQWCDGDLEGEGCTCGKHSDFKKVVEEEEEAQMVWDDNDGIWRCTDCLWEVEADSENEGNCHCCIEDPGETSPDVKQAEALKYILPSGKLEARRARRIELLYYHEYEPADSDSSGAENEDEEPDSDDEDAIDDDGPFDVGLLIGYIPPLPVDELQEDEESTTLEGESEQTTARGGSEISMVIVD